MRAEKWDWIWKQKRNWRKKRIHVKYYGADVKDEIVRLWIFSMFLCAKRLVSFIRDNLDYFSTKFGYSEEMKHKLSKISSATIGRMISLNKAQRWVKEAVDDVKEKLPFQMKGLTSLVVCSANCSKENSRYSISEASEKQSSISPVDKRIIPLLRLSFCTA